MLESFQSIPIILPRLCLSLHLAPSSSVFVLLFLNATVLIFSLQGPQQHNAAKCRIASLEGMFSSLSATQLPLPL